MKKRLLSFVLILILALASAAPALAVVERSDAYYVADYAGVLSAELEEKIISSNIDLEEKCKGAQIVVVTVEYLDGMYSDEYAATLFNNWGVGSKTENNGMLLLLATGENKAWLTVGAGISGSFTNNKADDYFNRYFWDAFDRGDYETAVSDMLEALFTWYAGYYNVNQGSGTSNVGNGRNNTGAGAAAAIFLVVLVLIVFVLLIVIVSGFAADRRRHVAYYTHLGAPVPRYRFRYIWGGPHRAWYFGPGGPGWHPRPRVPRPPSGGSWNGGSGGNNPGGGFGGFGGSGSGGGTFRGGGGRSGGGSGRGGTPRSTGSFSGGFKPSSSGGSSKSGGFGGFGGSSRGGGFGGFGGGSRSSGGGGGRSGGGGGRR